MPDFFTSSGLHKVQMPPKRTEQVFEQRSAVLHGIKDPLGGPDKVSSSVFRVDSQERISNLFSSENSYLHHNIELRAFFFCTMGCVLHSTVQCSTVLCREFKRESKGWVIIDSSFFFQQVQQVLIYTVILANVFTSSGLHKVQMTPKRAQQVLEQHSVVVLHVRPQGSPLGLVVLKRKSR